MGGVGLDVVCLMVIIEGVWSSPWDKWIERNGMAKGWEIHFAGDGML